MVCFNGTMVSRGDSSSSVPFIGLYVATGNLVCFILMGFDVFAGFRSRNLWFPCRFFSLNSITLALLPVATKIPVDLTSQMPCVQDQLSKLTGTVFICLAMSFMISSIGNGREFESYANITALSIFVITVIVNICTQMATGIIFCFFVEHSIIMFCLLMLLLRFWFSAVVIHARNLDTAERNKDLIVKTHEPCLLSRLKRCYLHGYNSCPQFFLSCKVPSPDFVTFLCAICLLNLIEAMLRSLAFDAIKFCGRCSDYGWSMWLMVVTQLLTILIATIVTGLRWITFARHLGETDDDTVSKPYLQFLYLFSLTDFPKSLETSFRFLICYPHIFIDLLLARLSLRNSRIISTVMGRNLRYNFTEEGSMETIGNATEMGVTQWIIKRCEDERKRWMDLNTTSSPKHLMEMLSRNPPSETYDLNTGSSLSSLSVLLLVDLARVSTLSSENVALTNILSEVFETIHFIDRKVNGGSFRKRLRSMYANVLWKFGSADTIVNTKVLQEIMDEMIRPPFRSEHVLGIMKKFKNIYYDPIVKKEADEIVEFMHRRSYVSRKELFDHIQQLFADMLHSFLARLPEAIINHVLESPVEEYKSRVRYGLGLVCKFQIQGNSSLPATPLQWNGKENNVV